MKWVTWRGVHVDRMGCAWLIKKYVDSEAEFLFVPPDQEALMQDATPFDVPGARYSHHQGYASFHAIVKEFAPNDPILRRMALIIDEADVTQELALEPIAPGLDAICTGILLYCQTDHERIEKSAILFDALYAALEHEEEAL